MSDFFKMMGEASEKSGKKVKISFEFVGEAFDQVAKEDTAKEDNAKEAPQILTEYVEEVDLNQSLEHLELDSFLLDLQVTEEPAPPKERAQFPPWYNKEEEEKPKKVRKPRSTRRLTEEQRRENRKEYNRIARERAQAKKNKEEAVNPFGAVKQEERKQTESIGYINQ